MQDLADYRPSGAVLAALQNVSLVIVVGPSGSGKTTLVNLAREQDPSLQPVKSDTSRAPREGEQHGIDYFFLDKATMLASIERQEYVQVAPSNSGDIYATHIENYTTTGTALITAWADAVPALRALPFKSTRTLFILPPSYDAWLKHLGAHGFDENLRAKRIAEAEQSLKFALHDPEVELILNDDLGQATADFLAAIHRPIHDPAPDQATLRQIVQQILDDLKQHQ